MFTMSRAVLARWRRSQPLTIGGLQMSEKVPILVVLGTDAEGKWHASRFEESERLTRK